ncbi:hypothetical protein [Streptomyces sp. NPDC007991]|uniref:hypothetical protein n=1 Tax=Streptomyces sp. NPDC007991 TaxID=3364803 RepID=UPI0036E7E4D2
MGAQDTAKRLRMIGDEMTERLAGSVLEALCDNLRSGEDLTDVQPPPTSSA